LYRDCELEQNQSEDTEASSRTLNDNVIVVVFGDIEKS
jgi:hypothetical protein